jgi:phosphohistidine swiveling domain-containing protein
MVDHDEVGPMTLSTYSTYGRDVVYPPELAGWAGWVPSTVTTPISPLEFDLRAKPFADGFRRALRDMIGAHVEVGVRRSDGHLFTLVMQREPHDAGGPAPHGEPDDFREHWLSVVRPATVGVIERLAEAVHDSTRSQLETLAAAGDWTAEMTYLHHTMLIPARGALAAFADFVVHDELLPSELDALSLVAGYDNATTTAARRLWQLSRCAGGHSEDGRILELLAEVGQEGEGYGLRHRSWLETATVPKAVAHAYAAGGPESAPGERQRVAAERRRALQSEVRSRLRRRGHHITARFVWLRRRARSAIAVTEDHAPLMHTAIGHRLRQLVLGVGAEFVRAGMLRHPDDVLHLHFDEIATRARHLDISAAIHWTGAVTGQHPRRVGAPIHGQPGLGTSHLAGYVRQVFGSRDPHPSTSAEVLTGEPASPGCVTGKVRHLLRHVDLGQVRPGEIVVAPNNSAIWSFALPLAAAVVAPGGSRLGHLASLARDYARPAVVGLDGIAGFCKGEEVEVDGDAGKVTRACHGRRTNDDLDGRH